MYEFHERSLRMKNILSTAALVLQLFILALGLGQLEEKFQLYQNLFIFPDLCTNHLTADKIKLGGEEPHVFELLNYAKFTGHCSHTGHCRGM